MLRPELLQLLKLKAEQEKQKQIKRTVSNPAELAVDHGDRKQSDGGTGSNGDSDRLEDATSEKTEMPGATAPVLGPLNPDVFTRWCKGGPREETMRQHQDVSKATEWMLQKQIPMLARRLDERAKSLQEEEKSRGQGPRQAEGLNKGIWSADKSGGARGWESLPYPGEEALPDLSISEEMHR